MQPVAALPQNFPTGSDAGGVGLHGPTDQGTSFGTGFPVTVYRVPGERSAKTAVIRFALTDLDQFSLRLAARVPSRLITRSEVDAVGAFIATTTAFSVRHHSRSQ